jgi:non-ribosomal peptide synthetase component F
VKHRDLPFETLVEQLQPDRAAGRQSVFEVMFVFRNMPLVAPRTSVSSRTRPPARTCSQTGENVAISRLYEQEFVGQVFAKNELLAQIRDTRAVMKLPC